MKSAYFFLSRSNDSSKDRVSLKEGKSWMIGVKDIEDAAKVANELIEEGFGQIELCGGFKEEGCRKLIELTGNRICFNYAVHLPEQEDLYQALFPSKK
ncbi:MAG: hypothetical protein IIZ33_01375 [Erysipelotrichaceae bacterium]|nr:hypothetical protein [Erysipelotrichaceae bacterium]